MANQSQVASQNLVNIINTPKCDRHMQRTYPQFRASC